MQIQFKQYRFVCEYNQKPYFYGSNSSYEWFYYHAHSRDLQVILILCFKDPFTQKNGKSSSIYFSLIKNNKKILYSYTFYKDINKFLGFCSGIENQVNFEIPDFSMKSKIILNLQRQSLPQLKNDETQKEGMHFWQFIRFDQDLKWEIKIENEDLQNQYQRASLFYDVALSKSLLKAQKINHPLSWKSDFTWVTYEDHNYGLEQLSKLKSSWQWWHILKNDHGFDVGYFFNQNNQGLLIEKNNEKIDHILINEKPKIKKNAMIEFAPFYLRYSLHQGSLESLKPYLIQNQFNQIALKSRIIEKVEENFYLDVKVITKNNGKSFYFASLFLSHKIKEQAYVVYTICRLIDDLTDLEINVSYQEQMNLLDKFFDQSKFNSYDENQIKKVFPIVKESLKFLDYLRDVLKRINIPKEYFVTLLKGQISDKNFQQPKNQKEFLYYCDLVAGVVGRMMIYTFNIPLTSKFITGATHLGIAMQITNILRDLHEDYFKLKRIYLDQQIYSFDHYKEYEVERCIHPLKELALKEYQASLEAARSIPNFFVRRCVLLMIAFYSRILFLVQKSPHKVVSGERMKTGLLSKIIMSFKVIVLNQNPLTSAGFKKL